MKRLLTITLALAIVFAGCKSMNKTQKGAAVGVGAGAAMGAIIGKAAGNTALGAVIGATVGGASGAIIGKKMDKQAEEIKKEVPNAEVIHNPGDEGIIVNFKSNVLFATDKYALTAASKKTVNDLITILGKYPDTDLKVEGHTDSQGSEAYNQTLSEKRAKSVADYLKANNIAASRLTTIGYGETQPVASNDTDEGRAQNRRVTFVITANEKMKADAQKEAAAK
jgi:outer membrane protein OmpA-like peptidoglycan-associated protein